MRKVSIIILVFLLMINCFSILSLATETANETDIAASQEPAAENSELELLNQNEIITNTTLLRGLEQNLSKIHYYGISRKKNKSLN